MIVTNQQTDALAGPPAGSPTAVSAAAAQAQAQAQARSERQSPPSGQARGAAVPGATPPATSLAPPPAAGQPGAEALAACPPNSNDASVPVNGGAQCIAEHLTSTRWSLGYAWNPVTQTYTGVPCVKDPRALVPNAVYKIQDCRPYGLQAEGTAQARVVAQLNAAGVYGDSSASGITPNLQWETTVPGASGRPDLVLYDRNNAAGQVGLVEMKGTWSNDNPLTEVKAYVTAWPAGTRPVVRQHFATPINDTFQVELDPACKDDPAVHSKYLFHTYSDPVNDGVIWVDKAFQPCPDRKKQNQTEGDALADGYAGTIGADTDHNGIDDMWDTVKAHTDLWMVGGEIPVIAFVALQQPVKVYLSRQALYALEEGLAGLSDEAVEAAWRSIVQNLPDVFASSEAAILAGDGAAAGLDAGELLVAEAILADTEVGAVTLSFAVTAGLVAIAIVAVIALIYLLYKWGAFGDPHMATLDGLSYDLQAVGEFHLLKAPSLGLDVQARFTALSGTTTISMPATLALSVNGTWVELGADGSAVVNGQPLPATQALTDLGNGATLARHGGTSIVSLGASKAQVVFDRRRIGFSIPSGIATTGLLGNHDGVPGNDLALADGTPLGTATPEVIHGPFADSWRVTNSDSLFSYGEDQDTATFTDHAFPSNVVSLDNFPASDQDIARQTCNSHNVPAGPQFDACMLDVIQTGDAAYADTAAAVTTFLQDVSAHGVDAGGDVAESFDGAVARNFRPSSIETIGGGKAAGPVFDGSGYSFTVPSVPNHSGVTVAFDVYAVGLTAANAENQHLTVTVGAPATTAVVAFTPSAATVSSGPATVTALGSGTTPQGAAYQKYHVSMTAPQYQPELSVQLAPSGFRGLIGSSMALDTITAHVTLVPAQTFAASLPLTVAPGTINGTTAAGAGSLETTGSADVYSFTVATAATHLGLAMSGCPTGSGPAPSWRLQRANGSTIASGGCGGQSLAALDAGSYTLTVTGPGAIGTYSLSVEAPQTFAVSVPLTVAVNSVNGTATTGAGRFETAASQDAYTFTVPTGGRPLAVSLRSCPATGYWTPANWRLIDTATQRVVDSGGCYYDDLGLLPAGNYQLLVSADGTAGSYTVDLVSPETFAVSTPMKVTANTVNGTATAGAGTFETSASQDIYTFTVAGGGASLNLNVSACPTQTITYLGWKLLDSTGARLTYGGCGYSNLPVLAAGTYRLVFDAGGLAGTYAANLEAPQTFAVALPLIVASGTVNGTATAGAGSFETTASQDVYAFTVGAGGAAVNLNVSACPTQIISYLRWKLLDSAGATVKSGGCSTYALGAPAAGDYRLVVDAGGLAGPYALSLVASQSFPATTPLAVSAGTVNGTATPGAGTLETAASQDVYTFTVAAGGQSLNLNVSSCPTQTITYLHWTLFNSAGTTIKSGGCGYSNLGLLPAGAYQLAVGAGGLAGTYALALEAPQTFAVSLPLTVTANTVNGTVTAGAGRFETTASQDVYSLTVPTGGQNLSVTVAACPTQTISYLAWKLLDSTGATVKSGGCSAYNLGVIPAGAYRLVVDSGGLSGNYTITAEAAQAFAVTVPLKVSADTVNGSAATGAGKMETAASQDIYTFTVPSGGLSLNISVGSCPTQTITYLGWKLLDSTGATVKNGGCGFYNLGAVPAGDYRLAVSSGGLAGTYALALEAPQSFAVTLPLTVAANTVNGAAVTGAGRFETTASQDVYSLTVPTGGQSLYLTVGACPTQTITYLGWKLLDSTGATVKNGGCSAYNLGVIPAGAYQLVVSSGGLAGTYTVAAEAAQSFAVTVPLAVSADTVNGAGVVGAGRMETAASQDIYTFTVPSGGQNLNISAGTCPTQTISYLGWKLVNSAGATVKSGGCDYYNLGLVPAGAYQLVVAAGGLAGPYSLNVEASQSFAVTLPLTASANTINGVAVTGAGKFETKASQDVYTFTVPAGGQNLNVTAAACPTQTISYLGWKLLDSTGATVKSGSCSAYDVGLVPAGAYRLVVDSGGLAGTYTLNVEASQSFAVSLPLTATANTVNGASVTGAGKFETAASQDIYTFTVPSGGLSLNISVGSCPTQTISYLGWKLLDSTGATVKSGSCSAYNLGVIPAGAYKLAVSSGGLAGTYALALDLPQTFAGALPLTVSANTVNGAAASGAGKFETTAAQDVYTLAVPSGGQALTVILSGCPTQTITYGHWRLLDGTGTQVKSGSCSTYNVGTIAAGSYTLVVDAGGLAGTYALTVRPT
ncbi:hypothetical protein GCM10020218_001290 [Dactylosporangium vinaceum]